jgi:hypothetical protein
VKEKKMTDYRQLLMAFLEKPTNNNFINVRNFVISHDTYAPYDQEEQRIEMLYAQGEYEAVNQAMSALMPNWLLSPYIHLFWSIVANKLAQLNQAKTEIFIAQMCLKGILSTGEGSTDCPFLVTRILDEYDVLRKMEKTVLKKQSVIKKEGKYLDYILCDDGTEIVFDVTDCYTRKLSSKKRL